jgi:hypothetical protein
MRATTAVLLACVACFGLKLAGYLIPARWVAGPLTSRITTLLPVALLSALIAVQAFTTGRHLVLDARLAAVAVALVLLRLRTNFIVVVLAAAAVAAGLRALGWG